MPRNNATSSAVCHHGAMTFGLGDSILGVAIVAMIPPRYANTRIRTDSRNARFPLRRVGSRKRYPRTTEKLRQRVNKEALTDDSCPVMFAAREMGVWQKYLVPRQERSV